MSRAVCLLSSGLDSSVAMAMEMRHSSVELALTADYGQRAAAREVEHARKIAQALGVRHEVVELPFFRRIPGGALLDASKPLPTPDRAALNRGGEALVASADHVWVPNRNAVLIQVAAAYAEALGCERVIVGFNREEAQTFPDNTREFLEACNAALRFSTRELVSLHSPTVAFDKLEIVREAVKLRVPLELVWPCYEGGENPCGICESCERFRRAIDAAAVQLRRPPFGS